MRPTPFARAGALALALAGTAAAAGDAVVSRPVSIVGGGASPSARPVSLVYSPRVDVGVRQTTLLHRCALADLDGDNDVDSADLNLLLAAFGDGPSLKTDVDGDGDTDSADLNIVLAAFGDVCQ